MQQLPTLQPNPAAELSADEIARLSAEIRALAAERNAVILAHNYQLPEIQDVADHMGDSLGLSRQAASTDAEVIVFCGVHFMAETASILSPDKTVLIPDRDAGCSLSDSIDADQLRAWKAEHPGAVVVMYVNTSAEVKSETDYCCTSSNAVSVVEHIWAEHGPETEILFGPDMWLGSFVARETGLTYDPERYARFHVWDGECHVHAGIRPDDITRTRAEHPDAEFLIHPECGCSTQALEFVASGDISAEGVHMLSTSGMLVPRHLASRGRVHRRDRERDALPVGPGRPGGEAGGGQPDGLLQVHEDDHAAEGARFAARDEGRDQGPGRDRRAGAHPDRAHGRDRLTLVAAGPEGGERLRFSDAEFVIRASAETTGGTLGIVEEIDPLDTPPHVHRNEDEIFYVLEGEHVFRVGDHDHRVGPGGVVFAPRGIPHSQRRVVPRTGRTLSMVTPAGFEGFFRELAAAEEAGTIGPEAYAQASERYGITWL